MSDLLSRLKSETSDCHEALEQALDLARPDMQRDDYIQLLSRFRGFVGPWERSLAAAMPARLQAFIRPREKTTLLDADLIFLTGGALIPEQLPQYPAASLSMASLAQAFGSMYVLEGSTLGGRFIGPAMAKRFDLSGRSGYAYFDPYEMQTGSMWNAFKSLAAQEVAVADHDAAVDAAKNTFSALRQWLAPVDARERQP